MKKILFILAISISSWGRAQELRIDSLFKLFQKDIEIEQKLHEGAAVMDNDTKENFYLLIINSPVDSLAKWVHHPNPAIRCEMFAGLYMRGADEQLLKSIYSQYAHDTAIFRNHSGHVGTPTVADYMKLFFYAIELDKSRIKIDLNSRLNKVRQEFRMVLPGLRHGFISKEAINKLDSIEFNHKEIKACSFKMIVEDGIKNIQLKSESNLLTQEMKRIIARLKPGDVIMFEDIRALREDGSLGTVGYLGNIQIIDFQNNN